MYVKLNTKNLKNKYHFSEVKNKILKTKLDILNKILFHEIGNSIKGDLHIYKLDLDVTSLWTSVF